MTLTQQTAKHLRDVFFGGNWTASNLRETLSEISWKEATTRIDELNTIAILTFHISYYLDAIIDISEGRPLAIKDEFSFDCPEISSEQDWIKLQKNIWKKVENAAAHVEALKDEQLSDHFVDEKYGTYFRNVHGLIEHTHYHLGQIALLKRLVKKSN